MPTISNPLVELMKGKKEPSQHFVDKPAASVHEFYLNGEIEEPSCYTEWFNTIRHATPNDIVKIYINSCGGDLWTAIQFVRVIRESKATVIASVEGSCFSAATRIFLVSDQYEISPHSMFMFHNYSAVFGGKGGEIADQLTHYKGWSEEFIRDIYKDFLSEKEIDAVLANKDLWMASSEVVQRLTARGKIMQKELEKAQKERKKRV